jgi:hypothetical protein
MMPVWSLAAAALVVQLVGRLRLFEIPIVFGALALFYWYFSTRLPITWVYGYNPDLSNQLLVYPAILAAAVLALLYLVSGHGLGRSLALVLTALSLTWGPAAGLAFARTPGSTTYFFGTSGQREAAAVVDSLTAPDEFYVASKDVAWYARNQHYLDQETLEYFVRAAGNRFDGRLVDYDVRVLALWVRPDPLKDLHREVLAPLYDVVSEHGDYVIWVRRDQ